VATATIEAELAVVDIICAVAVATPLPDRCLHGQRLAVAALARDVHVRAIEPEVRLPVVIEAPLEPVDRVVAHTAVLAETPVMRVLFAMAFHAPGGRIAEDV
jgi:hypothetical protein